ncbi:MAG: CRTAC1 family protein [Myxococcota bacterium]
MLRAVPVGWLLLALVAAPASAQFGADYGPMGGINDGAVKVGGVTWADFNLDGFVDVASHNEMAGRLWFSNGASPPVFTDVTMTNAPGLAAMNDVNRSLVAADLTNDGAPDLVRCGFRRLEVYVNEGAPDYAFPSQPDFLLDNTMAPPFVIDCEGIGILDLDEDGFLDVVFVNGDGLRTLANRSSPGNFSMEVDSMARSLPVGTSSTMAHADYLTVTDWDRDGQVDIAARRDGPDFWRRDGASFSMVSPDLAANNARKGAVAFCDFNNDSLFDFVFTDGTGSGVNRVWLQRNGTLFANSDVPMIDAMRRNVDVVCGDVDNDGDVDFMTISTEADLTYLNQLMETGTMTFVEGGFGVPAFGVGAAGALVDFDRDGDLDYHAIEDAGNDLWVNDANDQNYLMVRVLADVGECSPSSILRDDIGATVRLSRDDWENVREVNGGRGHGAQDSPFLHFGLPDGPTMLYQLAVSFLYGDEPDITLEVQPSALGPYQLIEVVSGDVDNDTIRDSDEQGLADPDPDGDGIPAHLDTDSDGDGLLDRDEAGDADRCTPPADSDGNGTPDYLEAMMVTDAGVDADASVPDAAGDADPMARVDARPDAPGPPIGDTGLTSRGSGFISCDATMGTLNASWVPLILFALPILIRRRRRRR